MPDPGLVLDEAQRCVLCAVGAGGLRLVLCARAWGRRGRPGDGGACGGGVARGWARASSSRVRVRCAYRCADVRAGHAGGASPGLKVIKSKGGPDTRSSRAGACTERNEVLPMPDQSKAMQVGEQAGAEQRVLLRFPRGSWVGCVMGCLRRLVAPVKRCKRPRAAGRTAGGVEKASRAPPTPPAYAPTDTATTSHSATPGKAALATKPKPNCRTSSPTSAAAPGNHHNHRCPSRRRKPDDPTFHEFASQWFEGRRHEVSPRSVESDKWALTHHLLPFFKDHHLSQIRIPEVDRYKNTKVRGREQGNVERPLSNRTINATLALLAQVMEMAVEYGHIRSTRRAVSAGA